MTTTYNVIIPFENTKARAHAKSMWAAKWDSVNKFWIIEVKEKHADQFQSWLKYFGLTLAENSNNDEMVESWFGYMVKKSDLAKAQKAGFDGIETI